MLELREILTDRNFRCIAAISAVAKAMEEVCSVYKENELFF